MYIVVKLSAPNNTFGNPRRVFVVYRFTIEGNVHKFSLVEAIDEGFGQGEYRLKEKYPDHIVLGNYETTTKEYKWFLKNSNKSA